MGKRRSKANIGCINKVLERIQRGNTSLSKIRDHKGNCMFPPKEETPPKISQRWRKRKP
jgi:hypothetical protein